MSHRNRLTVVLAVVALLTPGSAPAALQEEVSVTFDVENPSEGPNTIKVTTGGEYTRMDMSEEASLVFGPDSFIMIAHTQRMWMEFTREMLERMRQMMGNMPGAESPDSDEFDPDAYSFATTGNSEAILGYEAVEVTMAGPEGQGATLWLAEDAPTGLFDVFAHVADELSAMGGPMMRGGPMGGGEAASMRGYMQLARARGLPAGKVLRMVSNDGVTMTATALETGPFGDDWKTAPADYTKQSMPMMPR